MQDLALFHLIVIIFGGLFIAGFRAITDGSEKKPDDQKIFYFLRKFFAKHFPVIGKPIILCSWCMASVWGSVTYFFIALALRNYSSVIDTYLATLFFWIGWPFCVCWPVAIVREGVVYSFSWLRE